MLTVSDHPGYGTCLACTQGVRILKDGRTARHNRKQAYGNVLATVSCLGSREDYAEKLGVFWDPYFRQFREINPTEQKATE